MSLSVYVCVNLQALARLANRPVVQVVCYRHRTIVQALQNRGTCSSMDCTTAQWVLILMFCLPHLNTHSTLPDSTECVEN